MGDRKVLLVGDSTIKYIDKRRVLRDQTISKCRASTISEAHYKIMTGSNHVMEKVIFCVGFNDVKNGSRVIQEEMERLLRETTRRHPGCKIYICSILPVNSEQFRKEDIKRTNAQFKQFSTIMDNVYYVDILTEFISHNSMQELFERDQIHPNVKGTTTMTICIRSSLLHDHRPRQQFVSKRANTSNMTYAGCVSVNQISRDTDSAQSLAGSSNFNPATSGRQEASVGQYAYQPRPYPNNVWWHPGNYYPHMMPFYPPGMTAPYPSVYPISREERQPVRTNR
jgi:hypothetical protein